MKKTAMLVAVVISGMVFCGCSFKRYEALVRPNLTVDEAVLIKVDIDNATNPAKKYILSQSLSGKIIRIHDALVKDVIPSTDVDYQFCVIATMQHEKGAIDFYIYSKDYETIAKVEKGKTHIAAIGDVRRFFSLLDESFLKIDIADADIHIRQ
jgi:hypothetical protein